MSLTLRPQSKSSTEAPSITEWFLCFVEVVVMKVAVANKFLDKSVDEFLTRDFLFLCSFLFLLCQLFKEF